MHRETPSAVVTHCRGCKTARGGGGGGGGGGEGDGGGGLGDGEVAGGGRKGGDDGGGAQPGPTQSRHFDPALSDALVPSVTTAGVHAASSRVTIEASPETCTCCA